MKDKGRRVVVGTEAAMSIYRTASDDDKKDVTRAGIEPATLAVYAITC